MSDNITVLIVDDNDQNRKIISRYLKVENFSVFEVQNAEEAFSFLKIAVPDAILMDYQMPGLDGLKTIELIRENNLKSVIIMMTAYTSQEVVIGAIRSQADDFLSKPLNFKNLGKLIKETIERRSSNFPVAPIEPDDLGPDDELFTSLVCCKNGSIFFNYTTDDKLLTNVKGDALEKFSNLVYSSSPNKSLIGLKNEILDISIGNFHFIIKKENELQMYFILNENQYLWANEFDVLYIFNELLVEMHEKCSGITDLESKSSILKGMIQDKLITILDSITT